MARRLPLVRSEAIFGPANRSTGTATATIMIAAADSTAAIPTRQSMVIASAVNAFDGSSAKSAGTSSEAPPRPAAAPMTATITACITSGAAISARDAPNAARTAKSLRRNITSARVRLARLAMASKARANYGGQQHQYGVALRAIARFPKIEHAIAPVPLEDRRPLVLDRRKQRRHLALRLRRGDAGPEDARRPVRTSLPARSTARRFSGVQNSVRVKAGSKPARITPMIVCDSPSRTSVRPITDGVAAEAALPEAVAQDRDLHIVGRLPAR